MPATDEAARYAQGNRYADAVRSPAAACANIETGRWTLPIGNLVIVDDESHLSSHHLRRLVDSAARTNTNDSDPARTLTAALNTYVPWARRLRARLTHASPTTAAQLNGPNSAAPTATTTRSRDC